jgi:hypothetical protein
MGKEEKVKYVLTVWWKDGKVETFWYVDEIFADIMRRYYEGSSEVLKVGLFKEEKDV